jgi:hypothetical protein
MSPLPLEDAWVIVPSEQLDDHITTMKPLVAGKHSDLVFTLYEVCSSEWEKGTIIVPRPIPADERCH